MQICIYLIICFFLSGCFAKKWKQRPEQVNHHVTMEESKNEKNC